MQNTTIAAIATAPGAGGIAVVRLSGPESYAVAARVFHPANPAKRVEDAKGYTALFGHFMEGEEAFDEGVALFFRAPHSYTGEDVVELSCHGGSAVARRLVEACIAAGAVPAAPGEYTRRAFLNGKMSLTQAEAVMDVIGAAGKRELAFAHAQQNGALFHRVQQISQGIVRSLGDLAAWADYPEDEIPAVTPESLHAALQPVLEQLDSTLATYDYGRILQSGVSAVIVGKPNVGKSTLFNLLSGSQRSIVTEIAGTTRDVVEEQIRLGNVTLRLSDTAGLRETEDVIEQMGVKIAEERLAQADLILAVFDTTRPLDDDDRRMLEQLPEKPVIAILNKSDQSAQLDTDELEPYFSRVITMAAREGSGLEQLQQAVEELFYQAEVTPELGIVANARQKQCLEQAREQVQLALEALDAGELLDAVTPGTVIISVGSNSYGHPAEDTLRRLARAGCAVYRTDRHGTVYLSFD